MRNTGEVDSSANLCEYMNAYEQHMLSVYIVWALHPDTAMDVSIYVHNMKIYKNTNRKTKSQNTQRTRNSLIITDKTIYMAPKSPFGNNHNCLEFDFNATALPLTVEAGACTAPVNNCCCCVQIKAVFALTIQCTIWSAILAVVAAVLAGVYAENVSINAIMLSNVSSRRDLR